MDLIKSPRKRLVFFLWLIALHSFSVGLGLVIQIPSMMKFFGYATCKEHFFPAQGGVFHIVMALGYALAASNLERNECLVIFSIIVKAVATAFLFVYYFAIEQIWSIIVSGIGDGLMMVILLLAWMSYSKSLRVGRYVENIET